ncbi:MAG: hypothetical protein JST75_06975 [Bacteroidetes bacterium]|nr:hypothetical protein [Bacteroidota bacterium]
MEENPSHILPELHIDNDASFKLKDACRWTRFISIVGLVGIAIMMLCLLLAGSYMIQISSQFFPGLGNFAGLLIFILIFFLLIAGFMVFLLYRFSSLVRKGIETQDQDVLNRGLRALQLYFTIYGVFAILALISSVKDLIHL